MVRFLTTEEGGRKTDPDLSDYRPTALFNFAHHSCKLSEGHHNGLGKWGDAVITMLGSKLPPENFELYEGPKKVADAVNLLTDPKKTPVSYPYPDYVIQDGVVYRRVRSMKVKQTGDMIMGQVSGMLQPPVVAMGDVSSDDVLYRPVGLGAQF